MKYKNVVDGEEYRVGDVGNYYGNLLVKRAGGRFFWSITDWNGDSWTEISEKLFKVLIKEEFAGRAL